VLARDTDRNTKVASCFMGAAWGSETASAYPTAPSLDLLSASEG
jgi:hypothetical protein